MKKTIMIITLLVVQALGEPAGSETNPTKKCEHLISMAETFLSKEDQETNPFKKQQLHEEAMKFHTSFIECEKQQ